VVNGIIVNVHEDYGLSWAGISTGERVLYRLRVRFKASVARLDERLADRASSKEPGSTPGGGVTYRYRDPERRREYMKNLMRARRAR
jgi:hypothetical protein